MSNYEFAAIDKQTGEEVRILAWDDYFGKHEYGYRLPNGTVLREKEYMQNYERKPK
jgi:hypothetical protein